MATAPQTHSAVPDQQFGGSPRLRNPPGRLQNIAWVFGAGSAREEARILIEMMRRTGASIEDTRELIEVPQKQEAALRFYALSNPQDASGIERALEFRKRVGR